MTTPAQPEGFPLPPGVVFLTSHGHVQLDTVRSWTDLRAACVERGFRNIGFEYMPGSLVDKARNESASALLASPGQWLFFIDADMTFAPDTFFVVLQTAFKDCPWADIVGAWCPLRGEPYLPTIDTGTGTWEPHEPGQGPLKVIRTGAAFILVKRHVYERMEAPWYGVRPAMRPLDIMAELDGYARQKFDGRNPFAGTQPWEALLRCASQDAQSAPRPGTGCVGEDSGFCDRAKALGFQIVVQTNAFCGHVDKRIITPEDHRQAIRKLQNNQRLALGVGGP